LSQLGINEGDLVQLAVRTRSENNRRRPQQGQPQNTNQPVDAERLRQHILQDNTLLERVRRESPTLADSVQDPIRFRTILQAQQQQVRERQMAWEEEQALLNSDPHDSEAQRKIYEMIQAQQIARNLETAMEETPEGMYSMTSENHI
jgi:nitrate/nitrite-specific signal transduction histidine kinase